MSADAALPAQRFPDLRARVATIVVALPILTLALVAPAGVFVAVVVVATLVTAGELARFAARATGTARGLLVSAAGLLACVILPTHLVALRLRPDGVGWVLVALALTWGGDGGGYVAGRRWGRRRLAPRISPNKTVVGAVAGLLVGVTLAFPVHAAGLLSIDARVLLLIALPGQILAQLGDLAESALKRVYGVKDSGRLLPGHGGMLDTLDGLVLVVPWLYWATRLTG